jgi:small subunit ribosomal protein S1
VDNLNLPPADELESFAELLQQNDRERAGAVDRSGGSKRIDGTVVAISAESVFIDVGYKTEGILPLTAFAKDDTVRGRDLDGYYELSRQHVSAPRDYSSLEEAFEAGGSVPGTVTGLVKGGLTVDIGMRAFMPSSRTGARDAEEMAKLVGQQVRVRITQLDLDGNGSEKGGARPDAIVDRRSVVEEEARAASDARFAELAEGQVVHGTVRSLTDFGAFVDLAGADALLHISDMSWQRISAPSEIVAVGDSVEVKILKIDSTDPVKRRIAVGLKQLQPHPWDSVAERFHLGDKVTGIVTRDADFGAFVEIAPGIEGLIHISEMAWGKKVRKPSDIVKIGDQVEAVILGIDLDAKRMSLGLKQALGDPFAELIKTIHAGAVIEGKVSRLTPFGAFVTVTDGVEGLVHISEIVADKRLNHPSEVLHVGETVKCKVLEIDREKRQLKLSIKQMIPTGADEFFTEHQAGDTVTGRVLDIDTASSIARIELGEGIVFPCSLPPASVASAESATSTSGTAVDLSQLGALLSSRWKTADSRSKSVPAAKTATTEAPLQTGQVRSFRLAAIDADAKTLRLELA